METKLELRNVSKSYGDNKVVNDVSFKLAANELVTLLGPSGSGKTTTMMMIAGFVEPDEGQILLDDTSIAGLAPYRRNLGVVFQSYALFPHMSIAANVEFPLRQRGVSRRAARAKAEELLELVGLRDLGSRRVPQLSGGQQQRVALARALVFDPPLLIMDEPLSALDKRLREQMQDEIKRIQQAVGVTVLCVTHDQTEAFVLSDRIAVMNEGRILQVGRPEEVYDHPVNDFVAEFLGESNLFHGTVQTGDGPEGLAFETEHGLRLGLAQTSGDGGAVLIRPERVHLRSPGSSASEPAGNSATTLMGNVASSSFNGSSTMYHVSCAGVRVSVRRPAGERSFAPGEAVELVIPVAACVLLPS